MYNPFSFARYKDLPNLNPMFGNIGKDWNNPLPNDLYIKKVPKNVLSAGGGGNVGTGLDSLSLFTFPAGTFRINTENWRAHFGGVVGSNDDNKRLTVDYDGNNLLDTGLIDIDAFGFSIWMYGKRDDATHTSIQTTLLWGNTNIDSAGGIISNGSKIISSNVNFLVVNNFGTNNHILEVKGESATATNSNINVTIATIDLVRF